ncbi:DUF445 domain-containing protein [Aneurinibacillus soli]|nr:DUF445 domain-containing protein [Aneurinibacillus soli]
MLLKATLFVLEAALVGGIADWFAVTALFRKPLGFPVHTELIPKSRDKLIDSVTKMVTDDLLSPTAIKKKFDNIHFVDWFIELIEEPNAKRYLGNFVVEHSVSFLKKLDYEQVSKEIEDFIKNKAEDIDIVQQVKVFFKRFLHGDKGDERTSNFIDNIISLLEKPEIQIWMKKELEGLKQEKVGNANSFIRRVVGKTIIKFVEKVDGLNTGSAAQLLCEELISLLVKMKDPDDPLRRQFKMVFYETVGRLEKQGKFTDEVNNWKNEIVKQVKLQGTLEEAIKAVVESISTPLRKQEEGRDTDVTLSLAGEWIAKQIIEYLYNFKKSQEQKEWVEKHLKSVIYRVIDTEYHIVGRIVREALEALSKEELNKFVEDKAGEDLQWIRINGSIVGGVAGMLLFLFLQFLYEPFVVPVIRSWVY